MNGRHVRYPLPATLQSVRVVSSGHELSQRRLTLRTSDEIRLRGGYVLYIRCKQYGHNGNKL